MKLLIQDTPGGRRAVQTPIEKIKALVADGLAVKLNDVVYEMKQSKPAPNTEPDPEPEQPKEVIADHDNPDYQTKVIEAQHKPHRRRGKRSSKYSVDKGQDNDESNR